MSRVRTNNVFGTTTDNPLTAGATTMNSAGLANLAAVSSAEAIIILDPNRVSGAPEIVVVTAHTGSATSATIQRGQFGTSAREHASGTEWVHGPVTTNATSFVTAADDQGDYVPMNAWESYTPTLTTFVLGTGGTAVGAFVRIGRTIHFRATLTFGTGLTVGDGTVSLPVTSVAAGSGAANIAWVTLVDTGTAAYAGVARHASTTTVLIRSLGTASIHTALSPTSPFTWASGDRIEIYGTYEAAS